MTEASQESQIATTYALNPHLRNTDLKVSVEGDKATLTGTVDEDVSRDLAEQIELGVSGINNVDNTAVDNRLVVQGAKPAANASAKGKAASAKGESAASKSKDNISDGWITTKVPNGKRSLYHIIGGQWRAQG